MASGKISRNFTKGIMNKSFDERLVPDGQYIDAVNIQVGDGSTDNSGVVKPVVGNSKMSVIATPTFTELSDDAVCVGSIADEETGHIYWLVTDTRTYGVEQLEYKTDMIVGANARNNYNLKYVIVSTALLEPGVESDTILKFNKNRRISAINIVDGVMYFTDGINEPRQIVLSKTYSYSTEDDILVIKAPPLQAPVITPDYTVREDSFMRDKTYCFAYRYKYFNGQYSATSQFTLPAFYPAVFDLDDDDATNKGMINAATGVKITYNSGPANVAEIELLFKYADTPTIYVISKINKVKLGIPDNTSKVVLFDEDKYVSVLPDYEILRLYDNVPFKAEAQTYMGNRLSYWNYSDGFDLIDKFGFPINVNFSASPVSTSETSIGVVKAGANYNLGVSGYKENSVFNMDLSGISLIAGNVITIQLDVVSGSYALIGGAVAPEPPSSAIVVAYSIVLAGNYASVFEFAQSSEFKSAIGTAQNINTDLSKVAVGTFTDVFNSIMPDSLGDFNKTASGISTIKEPAKIIASQGSSVIGIQIPAMQYIDTPSKYIVWYLSISTATVKVKNPAPTKSLKSNRSYQVGMIYFDKYGRSTPALVGQGSSFFIDAGKSASKNTAKVIIPDTQRAPEWAHGFKFAIRESAGSYENVFSSFFFNDPASKFAYFLLTGENARKVKEDDYLIVKSDSYGATKSLIEVQVLEKKDQEENFIGIQGKVIPSGTYIKLASSGLNVTDSTIFTPGKKTTVTDTALIDINNSYICPFLSYPLYDASGNVPIPEGSIIKMSISSTREGTGSCEKRSYDLFKTFRASRNYDDFMRFWEGEGISSILNTGTSIVGDIAKPPLSCVYKPGVLTNNVYAPYTLAEAEGNINAWKSENADKNNVFYFVLEDGKLTLNMMGVTMCNGVLYENSRRSLVSIDIQMYLSGITSFIFETKAANVDNGIFYEVSQSFLINKTTGEHYGNITNQNLSNGTACVIGLDDFNCISFGNGVESFKIKDSLAGRRFYLGNRAYATAYTDVKRVDRFADGTWSGTYNDDTNTDKLNQFVSGLLNYKHLEESFGPVMVAHGRGTDVMVIQENKISYVLTGKNLLSDSVDGGSVASIPEVLGTQIARIEEFGTVNPESFCSFASSIFFVDQRRGAVIKVEGQSYSNDKLTIMSDMYMTQWFREKLSGSEGKIILGGYDPHVNEYTVSFTEISKPADEISGQCGDTEAVVVNQDDTSFTKRYYIEKGEGSVDFFYYIQSANDTVKILVTGMESPITAQSGDRDTITVTIDNANQGWVDVEIFDPEEDAFVQFNVGCLIPRTRKIKTFVMTSNDDEDKSASVYFSYRDGDYISPRSESSFSVVVGNYALNTSFEKTVTGTVGYASIPTDDSTLYIGVSGVTAGGFTSMPRRIAVFQSDNDSLSLAELLDGLAESIAISSNNNDGVEGTVGVGDSDVIYLVYDFRTIKEVELSSSDSDASLCCAATEFYHINANTIDKATALFYAEDYNGNLPFKDKYFSDSISVVRIKDYVRIATSQCPGCHLECDDDLVVLGANKGIYDIKINTGGNVGHMPVNIKIDSASGVIGVMAYTYPSGSRISKVSWIGYGIAKSDVDNAPVFIGKDEIGVCEVAGSYSLPVFEFLAGEFRSMPNELITINEGQKYILDSLSSTGYFVGVPVLTTEENVVMLRIYVLCDGTNFTVTPACPQVLPSFQMKVTEEASPCDEAELNDTKYFYAMDGGSISDGTFMFDDPFGSSPVINSVIRMSDSYTEVDENGWADVVTACSAVSAPIGFKSSSSNKTQSSACIAPFDTVYYNHPGVDGTPSVGDTIYIDPLYVTKLVRPGNGTPAGNYKYGSGYISIGLDSVVTDVAVGCGNELKAIQATPVKQYQDEAINSSSLDVMYFDGSADIPDIDDTMYLDLYGVDKTADYQGSGYIYLPTAGIVILINENSVVIEVIPLQEV